MKQISKYKKILLIKYLKNYNNLLTEHSVQ